MPDDTLSNLVRTLDPLVRSWLNTHPECRAAIPAVVAYLNTLAGEIGDAKSVEKLTEHGVSPSPRIVTPIPAAISGPTIIAPRTSSAASVPLVLGDKTMFVRVEGTTADIGRARAAAQDFLTAPSTPTPVDAPPPPDPTLIEARCRIKAKSCRIYAERLAGGNDPEVLSRTKGEMDQLLIQGKALPRCFIWVFWREREQPACEIVSLCAECYENLAMVTPLTAQIVAREDLRKFRAHAMQLMATAQSALRTVLRDTWLTAPDADQDDAHAWLRQSAQRVQQLIPRHMRLDDGADPFAWEALRAEISTLKSEVDQAVASASKSVQKLNKLKYDVKRLEREGDAAPTEYWAALVAALQDFIPSDARVREALKPLTALTPAPEHAETITPFLDAARAPDAIEEDAPAREFSESVARCKAALTGSRVVITGGELYPHQQRNLEEAFELSEVDWVVLREHASSDPLIAAIRRPGTRLVLVLVKLAGHAHVEDAQNECRALGIPCVLLKAGVNPERVAADIIAQASNALGMVETGAK